MAKGSENKKLGKIANRRVHMANERTFLAWIRTNIGIMAFGFVVEKFALFLKQVSFFLGKVGPPHLESFPPHLTPPGWSSIFGIFLVGLGALMGVLAFIRYKKTEKQIDQDTWHPSLLLDILLTMAIAAIGVFLIIYLVHSL